MIYNSSRGRVLLYGGSSGNSDPTTWEWDGIAWTQLTTGIPGRRHSHALAYDSLHHQTLMFGGVSSASNAKSGETWTLLAPCPSDFNHDNTTDFFDYLDFVQAFASGSPQADFNNDSIVDFFDYLDFVQALSSGC